MVFAPGVSRTTFLTSDRAETCDRIKLVLQEEQACNKSDLTYEEIVAIVDKFLEYKCIYK